MRTTQPPAPRWAHRWVVAALALTACYDPWYIGAWGSRTVEGKPDTVVTVTCPGEPVRKVAAPVIVALGCEESRSNYAVLIDLDGKRIRCNGVASLGSSVTALEANCSDGWRIAGSIVRSAYSPVSAFQLRLTARVEQAEQVCSASVEGPVYSREIEDGLCPAVPDAGDGLDAGDAGDTLDAGSIASDAG